MSRTNICNLLNDVVSSSDYIASKGAEEKILNIMRREVTGGQSRLNNEEHGNLYFFTKYY
jgi:hypothetical protein